MNKLLDRVFRLLGQRRMSDIEDAAHAAIDDYTTEIFKRAKNRHIDEIAVHTILEIARDVLHEAVDVLDKKDDY